MMPTRQRLNSLRKSSAIGGDKAVTRLETFKLTEDAQWFRAGANVLLSVALCLVGVWLGHALAQYLNTSKGH